MVALQVLKEAVDFLCYVPAKRPHRVSSHALQYCDTGVFQSSFACMY